MAITFAYWLAIVALYGGLALLTVGFVADRLLPASSMEPHPFANQVVATILVNLPLAAAITAHRSTSGSSVAARTAAHTGALLVSAGCVVLMVM